MKKNPLTSDRLGQIAHLARRAHFAPDRSYDKERLQRQLNLELPPMKISELLEELIRLRKQTTTKREE